MQKIIKRIFLLFFSIIFTLVLIELGLRLLNIRPPFFIAKTSVVKFSENPVLGYELDPEKEGINSLGLHNKEIEIDKNDIFRILVLGDSITYGCCEESKVPFAIFLENNLQEKYGNKKIEVINAGVPGYNTIQEAELYKSKLNRLNPDLVILQYTSNDWEPKNYEFFDLIDNLGEQQRQSVFKYYQIYEKLKYINLHSLLIQNLLYDYTLLKYRWASGNTQSVGEVLEDQQMSQDQDSKPNYEKTGIVNEGFQQISELSKKNNTQVMVVIFPVFRDVSNYEEHLLLQHEYVSQLAKKNELPISDLLQCYQEDYVKNHNSFSSSIDTADVIHPNQYGHRLAANCISDLIAPIIENRK